MDEVLDFYLQIQSLSISTDQGSVIAATLANGGVSPLSKVPCMSSSSVRDTLSTMHSCGLYDYSGRWAFEVSLTSHDSHNSHSINFRTFISNCLHRLLPTFIWPYICIDLLICELIYPYFSDRSAGKIKFNRCNSDSRAESDGYLCLGATT